MYSVVEVGWHSMYKESSKVYEESCTYTSLISEIEDRAKVQEVSYNCSMYGNE